MLQRLMGTIPARDVPLSVMMNISMVVLTCSKLYFSQSSFKLVVNTKYSSSLATPFVRGTVFVPRTVPSPQTQETVNLHGNLMLILIYSMQASNVQRTVLVPVRDTIGLRTLIKILSIILINMKLQDSAEKQRSLISTDAPPLDFSFRSIKRLEDILTMNPQSGSRKPILVSQTQESKSAKTEESKSPEEKVEVPVEEEQVQKQVQTRLQIVRTVDVINGVNQSNQSNYLTKTKNEPIKAQKKTKSVQLLTSTLYLSYNKLRSIKQFYSVVDSIFPDVKNLKWIDLSHNYLVTLDYDFKDLPWLRTLYLHCNFINDFNQLVELQHLKELKTFTIHGNPLDVYPQFRTLVIGLMPQLHKIDSVLVTKRQYEVAKYFMKSVNMKKLPVILNADQPKSQSSDNQDD